MFVDRAEEKAALLRTMSEHALARPAAVLVTGDAGYGKTAAVREAARTHHQHAAAAQSADAAPARTAYVKVLPSMTVQSLLRQIAQAAGFSTPLRSYSASLPEVVSQALTAGNIGTVVIDDIHVLLPSAGPGKGGWRALRRLAALSEALFVVTVREGYLPAATAALGPAVIVLPPPSPASDGQQPDLASAAARRGSRISDLCVHRDQIV
ncbi:AAA family ATPase [Streptomyces sp. SID9124]|uniref:AAA family ATPase n=1 Tax=Streptomyces sp. SID9124 TaxID=2706108 RepID=UPI0013DF67FF|nr:AAA family ATPase [Streptomyces sp. SID9124]NED11805.1 AAA family ATPase [Streptomyces sp. SID9124]